MTGSRRARQPGRCDQIPSAGTCADLKSLDTSVRSFTTSVNQVSAAIPSSVTLTTTDLASLDDLSTLALATAVEAAHLSQQLRNLDDTRTLFEYRTALAAMLRLTRDIGVMAGRILEMADQILATQAAMNGSVAGTQSSALNAQTAVIGIIVARQL